MEQRRENGTGTITRSGRNYMCSIMHQRTFYRAIGTTPEEALFNAKQKIIDSSEHKWYFTVLKKKRKGGTVYLKAELLTPEEYVASGLTAGDVTPINVRESEVYWFGGIKVRRETVLEALAAQMGVSVDEVKGA